MDSLSIFIASKTSADELSAKQIWIFLISIDVHLNVVKISYDFPM